MVNVGKPSAIFM